MNLRIILKKEWIDLISSKKSLLLLFLFMFYPVILNLLGDDSSILDTESGVLIGALLVACLSSELVYLSLIEEVKYGILDLILISSIKKEKIIFFKLLIPSVTALVFSFGSILVNNIFEKFNLVNVAIHMNSLSFWLLIFFAPVFSSLITFITIINIKRKSREALTTIAISAIIAISVLFFLRIYVPLYIMFILLILIIVVLVKLATFSMNKNGYKTFFSSKNLIKLSLRDNTRRKVVFKREVIKWTSKKFRLIKFIMIFLLFTAINSSILEMKHIIVFQMFMLTNFYVLDLYFESMIDEKLSNVDEILYVAKFSAKKNEKYIFVYAYYASILISMIFVIINNSLSYIANSYMIFSLVNICLLIFMPYVMLSLSRIIINNFFKSIKDVRPLKIFIYLISIIVYLGLYLV